MAYFYCLPNSCGVVRYREYLPPQIRYRYENEDWIYIDGDDYSVKQLTGQCYDVEYRLLGNFISRTNRFPNARCGETGYWATALTIRAKILDVYIPPSQSTSAQVTFQTSANAEPITESYAIRYAINENANPTNRSILYKADNNCSNQRGRLYGNNLQYIKAIRVDDGDDDCGDCILTITLNGEIVHQETRNVCPKVEKLDSRLSDEVKTIKVEKLSYLEGIEVVPFARDVFSFSGDLGKSEIPPNCLSIYKTKTQPSIIPFPDYYPDYEFVAQICSAPAFPPLPPPEYQVVCNCDCESCPPNTCAVECTGHVCCYDTATGKSIKEIPVDKYCGDF